MSDSTDHMSAVTLEDDDTTKTKLVVGASILGALGASTCCILPLALFSLGASGAWIGRLTSLSPYQPLFILLTFGFLGYGYWLIYRKPKAACGDDATCGRPLPNRLVKSALWIATALVLLSLAWPFIVPILFG